MAEFILKKLATDARRDNLMIDSAATSTEEIGNDIYPPAKRCLDKHNIPYNSHRARQITKNDLAEYDYIIAMEEYNIKNLQRMFGNSNKYSLLLDYTNKHGDISDPWYTGDFETAYQEIEIGCKSFLEKALT